MLISDLELLRWALADHAFREADALAQHVLESRLAPDTHLFSAAVAGVAVSYCRPFTEGNGLGRLPEHMGRFHDSPHEELLRQTHDSLVEARNKMAAHFDRLHQERLHQKGEFQFSPSEVIVDLQPLGAEITTSNVHIHPVLLERAHGLFLFQIERVGNILGGFGEQLLRAGRPLGKHVFKVLMKDP